MYDFQLTTKERGLLLRTLALCAHTLRHPDLDQETLEHYQTILDLDAPLTRQETTFLTTKVSHVITWARAHHHPDAKAQLKPLLTRLRQPPLASWTAPLPT